MIESILEKKANGLDKIASMKDSQFIILVIAINFVIKVIPASLLELGNDEVYYWTYALFPDWSHFDHPPMVGFTIQLFSLNLLFDNEFFIRIGSLIFSSLNMMLLYFLVKKIYDKKAAIIAVFLFTASFYFNIIAGLLILPDSPQMFFVLLALYYGIPAITAENPNRKDTINILLFGFFSGLAFLSKYHSLFLWLGFGIYVLFNNRIWLRKPVFYLSILVTMVLMFPVLYWNIQNNFISFTFHGNRVGLFQSPVDFISFLQFNVGQILYQNPILFVIFMITIFKFFKRKNYKNSPVNKLLVYLSLPLIVLFTIFSLFRNTLPHWSGPAFIGLLILSSDWLKNSLTASKRKITLTLLSANFLVFIIIVLAFFQINTGFIPMNSKNSVPEKLGENDFTLDMFGWKQSKEKFAEFLIKDGIQQNDFKEVKIISNKWFPAAHIDYYIAHPLNMDLIVLGNIGEIHKYYWVNNSRRINSNDKVYFITSSQQYFNPENYKDYFFKIIPKDTLRIERNGTTAKNLFIYEMQEFNNNSFKLLNSDF